MKDHFRAKEVALWTWLLPNLEKVGSRYGPNSTFHRFVGGPGIFSGPTRPNSYLPPPVTPPPIITSSTPSDNKDLSNETNNFHMVHGSSLRERESKNSISWYDDVGMTYSSTLILIAVLGLSIMMLNLLVVAIMIHMKKKKEQKHRKERSNSLSPSHCRTINSSTTLRSIAQEWPPEYSACYPDNSARSKTRILNNIPEQDSVITTDESSSR